MLPTEHLPRVLVTDPVLPTPAPTEGLRRHLLLRNREVKNMSISEIAPAATHSGRDARQGKDGRKPGSGLGWRPYVVEIPPSLSVPSGWVVIHEDFDAAARGQWWSWVGHESTPGLVECRCNGTSHYRRVPDADSSGAAVRLGTDNWD